MNKAAHSMQRESINTFGKEKKMKTTRILAISVLVVVGTPAGVAKADFTFGEPTNLGPTVNSSYSEWPPSISADGLSLYFCSDRPGGYGGRDLWVTTRPTKDDEWDAPLNLGPTVNSSAKEALPSISADGLSLFFESTRTGGYGGHDLWVTIRATKDDDWGTPVNLGPMVNSLSNDATPGISTDGLSLFFESDRSGGYGSFDILVTTRTTPYADWSAPVNLGATVNSPAWDGIPSISADGLALFFMSKRAGGYGADDIWVTTRKAKDDQWEEPVNLGPTVNSGNEAPGSISADGLFLFFDFLQGGYGGGDMWQVSIVPIVDLNGDGIVDSADMCVMIDHWGENYSLCDIGPMPWGDGIVDVEDLVVLSEHLFEDVNDPTLVAHWPLDEAQGVIAYNNVGESDGTLMGNPVWQPNAGIVAGALQFDGTDDHVVTDSALNPADGAFSVVAWIKGGTPGQVVISGAMGSNWLHTDPTDGCLTTDIKSSGRSGTGPLLSSTIVTDGQWHRIGLVWDGHYRHLYVDGVEVAQDAAILSNLESALGGLHLGAGSSLAPGTFFSGLIDDVRIYNRAVSP
jgi:hypothetical protein